MGLVATQVGSAQCKAGPGSDHPRAQELVWELERNLELMRELGRDLARWTSVARKWRRCMQRVAALRQELEQEQARVRALAGAVVPAWGRAQVRARTVAQELEQALVWDRSGCWCWSERQELVREVALVLSSA